MERSQLEYSLPGYGLKLGLETGHDNGTYTYSPDIEEEHLEFLGTGHFFFDYV